MGKPKSESWYGKPKSESWYVRNEGLQCPYCESDQLQGSNIEIECGWAFQEMLCSNCQKHWTDHYKLVGYKG